jgi:hypothetical protein
VKALDKAALIECSEQDEAQVEALVVRCENCGALISDDIIERLILESEFHIICVHCVHANRLKLADLDALADTLTVSVPENLRVQ